MGRRRKTFNRLQPLTIKDLHGDGARASAASLEGLIQSLAAKGQEQPVLVTDGARRGTYRVVVGRKRVQAARRLGWATIQGVVLGKDFSRDVAIIERLQRGQFDPFELADTIQRLKNLCDWTQAQVGQVIGKTRDFVANILALGEILPEVRRYIQDHSRSHPLTARHLRYIAREVPEHQLAAARRIIGQRLSTKALEKEKRCDSPGLADQEFIRVRQLRGNGSSLAPQSPKEWRRYMRQLRTDLRRIDRREALEQRRAQELTRTARQRRALVRREAAAKRRLLHRELRIAQRWLQTLQ
jgi:ParB/RepB/Spo0J family partition protein